MKKNMLITGGAGDLSQYLNSALKGDFDILIPNRKELDVTSREDVESYFQKTSGSVDILINNAGVLHSARIADTDIDKWINDINVNLIGTYLVSKEAIKYNPNVIIINISSTAAFNAYKDWSSYCCAKAAVVTFTKCLVNDGYSAYCLCPGAIDTKFRSQFSIKNSNVMSVEDVSKYVIDVINGEYSNGDILFFRKNQFYLNPSWDIK